MYLGVSMFVFILYGFAKFLDRKKHIFQCFMQSKFQ